MVKQDSNTIIFRLEDNSETYKVYPFHFQLDISYKIENQDVIVCWNVKNTDQKTLYFSIGGHPAFLCPVRGEKNSEGYEIHLKKKDRNVDVINSKMIMNGLACAMNKTIVLKNGAMKVSEELFLDDALVLEDHQVDQIALALPDGREYLRVTCECALVGIWSPPGKKAPFICIEPWYGRCDAGNFEGTLEEREYGNSLEAGECFEKSYKITPLSV